MISARQHEIVLITASLENSDLCSVRATCFKKKKSTWWSESRTSCSASETERSALNSRLNDLSLHFLCPACSYLPLTSINQWNQYDLFVPCSWIIPCGIFSFFSKLSIPFSLSYKCRSHEESQRWDLHRAADGLSNGLLRWQLLETLAFLTSRSGLSCFVASTSQDDLQLAVLLPRQRGPRLLRASAGAPLHRLLVQNLNMSAVHDFSQNWTKLRHTQFKSQHTLTSSPNWI